MAGVTALLPVGGFRGDVTDTFEGMSEARIFTGQWDVQRKARVFYMVGIPWLIGVSVEATGIEPVVGAFTAQPVSLGFSTSVQRNELLVRGNALRTHVTSQPALAFNVPEGPSLLALKARGFCN